MTILISRRKPKEPETFNKNGVSRIEYDITRFILDYMGIDIEDDYSILHNDDFVKLKKRYLAFPHYYMSIRLLKRDQEMFRPLRHDSHADFLIELFTSSFDGQIDYLTYEENDKGNFDGHFVSIGEEMPNSKIFNIPSVPILKCAAIGKLMMDADHYRYFINKIMHYVAEMKRINNE